MSRERPRRTAVSTIRSQFRAIVLSMDEKTQIQALERTQLPLPLRAGRAARHTHDYKRHGVLDLYAALEIATGNVTHRVTESHTATDFLAFMNLVVQRYRRKQLHVVLDNFRIHGSKQVQAWMKQHGQRDEGRDNGHRDGRGLVH